MYAKGLELKLAKAERQRDELAAALDITLTELESLRVDNWMQISNGINESIMAVIEQGKQALATLEEVE